MNKEYTFEQALARLEEIVKGLENGSLPLDKSIELFEEGNALVKLCTQKLDAAEQKVRILTETAVGITEEDFNA
ncbi:MAG: exodeoxyribonuclease VII small subunit [Clostridia bacterium]|jgi:exodeoxyribonuclease VII small subunit|nr:exodeoxyribonuclease VII small subunit [Clostridia bacterium]MBR6507024.1 exodeoxyribonuclease VII small subunit [Clostridia bacterium]